MINPEQLKTEIEMHQYKATHYLDMFNNIYPNGNHLATLFINVGPGQKKMKTVRIGGSADESDAMKEFLQRLVQYHIFERERKRKELYDLTGEDFKINTGMYV